MTITARQHYRSTWLHCKWFPLKVEEPSDTAFEGFVLHFDFEKGQIIRRENSGESLTIAKFVSASRSRRCGEFTGTITGNGFVVEKQRGRLFRGGADYKISVNGDAPVKIHRSGFEREPFRVNPILSLSCNLDRRDLKLEGECDPNHQDLAIVMAALLLHEHARVLDLGSGS